MFNFFRRNESLIALDIGCSSVKLLELDLSGPTPLLLNIGRVPLEDDAFVNNQLEKLDAASEQITSILEANDIAGKRVTVAMPGPSVFTKRIQVAQMGRKELYDTIQFEASNYIPHQIDAVHMDFHVIGQSGKNQLDVLLVAVKNEIVDSFLEAIGYAGLETAVVDVDYFALQNMFEISYPDLVPKTVALINIGARYTGINICKGGSPLFTGDVSIGGKMITDEIVDNTGLSFEEAERLKLRNDKDNEHFTAVLELIDRNTEHIAGELNRQLSFFWSAAEAEEGIDRIMLSGGGALIPGLVEELSAKTGIECELMNSFRGIECGSSFEQSYLDEISPMMAVSVGLALRQPGDKIYNDEVEAAA